MYFSRIAPLLGAGLKEMTVACDEPRLIELLASARLGGVVTSLDIEAHLRWKNAHEPTRVVDTEPDIVIERRHSDVPFSEWRPGHVTIGHDGGWGANEVINDVARVIARREWRRGRVYYGNARWPFGVSRTGGHVAETKTRLGHVMVVGLGSVGSEALRHICAERFTLVDPARVSDFNPVRQWFGSTDVGRFKAEVLASRLPNATGVIGGDVRPRGTRATQSTGDPRELIADFSPDFVLLATGTDAHAEWSTACGAIPHVAACAYPQARFVEAIVCVPGAPAWHDFRRQTFQPVVSDDVARFLYQMPDSQERDDACRQLTAEPALASSTGRLADLAARCLHALATRPPWMARIIEEGTTCLLGANVDDENQRAGGVLRLRPEDTQF